MQKRLGISKRKDCGNLKEEIQGDLYFGHLESTKTAVRSRSDQVLWKVNAIVILKALIADRKFYVDHPNVIQTIPNVKGAKTHSAISTAPLPLGMVKIEFADMYHRKQKG